MATAVSKIVGGYAEGLYYGVVDSSGYLVGSTASAPAAGNQAGSAMAQLLGIKNFPFAPVDPDRPTQRGDAGALARFIHRPTELPESNMIFGASDYDFYALCQALAVLTLGGGKFVLGQAYNPTYADLVLLAFSQGKSQESASEGSGLWEARIILKTNIFPKGRTAFNDEALSEYEYALVSNYATAFPWGHAFSDADEGDTKAAYVDFTWPYRPILQRWTGNNTETSFNLDKNIAEDSADNIVVFVNGTAQTWVTGAPGAGEFGITAGTPDVLVLGTAPASNAKVVALYGWN
jgi:hypothetical protein